MRRRRPRRQRDPGPLRPPAPEPRGAPPAALLLPAPEGASCPARPRGDPPAGGGTALGTGL